MLRRIIAKYRFYVVSRLETGAGTAPYASTSGRTRTSTSGAAAAVLGDEGDYRRHVIAGLKRAGWSVGDAEDGDPATTDIAVVVAAGARTNGSDSPLRLVREALAAARSVVVVLADPSAERVRELLESGAAAVVDAGSIDVQLGPALAAVRAGLVVAPQDFRRAIERPALTAREKQALGMVVLGFSNADIARKLYVAESTVKSHLSSAFAKLGVRTRSEAAALILDRSQGLGTGILAIVGDGDAGAP